MASHLDVWRRAWSVKCRAGSLGCGGGRGATSEKPPHAPTPQHALDVEGEDEHARVYRVVASPGGESTAFKRVTQASRTASRTAAPPQRWPWERLLTSGDNTWVLRVAPWGVACALRRTARKCRHAHTHRSWGAIDESKAEPAWPWCKTHRARGGIAPHVSRP
jgi:hypothetical protein